MQDDMREVVTLLRRIERELSFLANMMCVTEADVQARRIWIKAEADREIGLKHESDAVGRAKVRQWRHQQLGALDRFGENEAQPPPRE